MIKTQFDENRFCIDDVLDYVKEKKKVLKSEKPKKNKEKSKAKNVFKK